MSNINNWYLNVDKSIYIGLMFIDLIKAFDTVSHELLQENYMSTVSPVLNFAGLPRICITGGNSVK